MFMDDGSSKQIEGCPGSQDREIENKTCGPTASHYLDPDQK